MGRNQERFIARKLRDAEEYIAAQAFPVRRKRTGKAKASACFAPNDGAVALVGEEVAEALEDLGVHGGGDFSGLRVLLAGVVDAEEAGPRGR